MSSLLRNSTLETVFRPFPRSPQMWVRPQVPFEGCPTPPHCNRRTFPSGPPRPLPPSSPHPLVSFCNALGGGGQGWCGGGVLGRRGVEGEGPPSCTWGQTLPPNTPSDTPSFLRHAVGHSPRHFGREGPVDSYRGSGMS